MGNAFDAAAAALAGAAGTAANVTSYFTAPSHVFMGYQKQAGQDQHDRNSGATTDVVMGPEQAKLEWYAQSDAARRAITQNLYNAGLIENDTEDAAIRAWNAAVDQAAAFYVHGRKLTPWEVLNMKLGTAKGGGGSGGGKARTRTDVSYSVPTSQDAEMAIRGIFSDAVGRAPNAAELAKYTTMMVGLAKKNPSVTTSVTDADGNVSSTTAGGISSSGLTDAVQGALRDTSEYGAYQAATTYFNLLQKAIASPV